MHQRQQLQQQHCNLTTNTGFCGVQAARQSRLRAVDTLAPLRGSQLALSSDPSHSPGATGKGSVQRSCRCPGLPVHAVMFPCCGG